MSKTISRRVFTAAATAVIAAGMSFAGSGGTANASADQMTVVSTTAPVWLSNHAVPVAVVVSNPAADLRCNPVEIKLVWFSSGGRKHVSYRSGPTIAGAYVGSIKIPARTVWPGTLRYKVIAHQTCGLMQNQLDRYRAASPSTGWARATIK
jgi:hypothetical protein